MKNLLQNILLILFVFLVGCGKKAGFPDNNNIRQKAEAILSEMTLEEKVGQMTQITLSYLLESGANGVVEPFHLDTGKLKEALLDYHVGSILNCGGHANSLEKWNEIITTIQDIAMNDSRMRIPVLYGIDAIHGANYTQNATLFPQQIAQAATFNTDISRKIGEITAYETRASGIPWTFSPVLGLGRKAAWPRFWETFGEDVYLATSMGKALTEGYQGKKLTSDSTKIAACMKHYVGYSAPNTGKDRTPASIPERDMRQFFLPPFAESVKAGVKTVMVNSGEINGVPLHISKYYLTHVLKEELNFEGFIVSDWMDIQFLHDRHKVAATQKEAVALAVNAGIDMSMVPQDYTFFNYLVELVKEGMVSKERIDDAVRRILKVKLQLGLFERPVTKYRDFPKFASREFSSFNLHTAEEAITLLKNSNDNLPLKKTEKVLITGPTANTMTALNGGWSYTWQGTVTDEFIEANNTILEAVQKEIGKSNVVYVPVSGIEVGIDIDKAVLAAQSVDKIILCLGEDAYCEKPGDINDLYLPEGQQALAESLAKTNKPVTLVLVEGRPRLISKFEQNMEAVLMAYLPGSRGGDAISNILFGDVNPSGKLPFTYPRYPNALEKYDHKHTEDLEDRLTSFNPQYEFGHGLSYTTFEYTILQLNDTIVTENKPLEMTVEVKNTGNRKGKESVLVFVKDHYASITPPVKQLKRYKKISLEAGEAKVLDFALSKDDLAFVDQNNKWITEEGMFTVMVDDLKKQFSVE